MATSNSIKAALVLFGALISHTAATTHDDTFYECMPGMPGPGGKLQRVCQASYVYKILTHYKKGVI